jgi:hypothetical protein
MSSSSPPKRSITQLVSLSSRHLTSFPRLPSACVAVTASNNPIRSLETHPTIDGLTRLDLSNTALDSFAAAARQPSLTVLLLHGSPLGAEPYLAEMALIVLSDALEIVNSTFVRAGQREFARAAASLRADLLGGWLLRALAPLRLVHARTRARKTAQLSEQTPAPSVGREPEPEEPPEALDDDRLNGLLAQVIRLSESWNPRHSEKQEQAPRAASRLLTQGVPSRVGLRRFRRLDDPSLPIPGIAFNRSNAPVPLRPPVCPLPERASREDPNDAF